MSAADVIQKAREQGIMVATAESCTGGLLAGALTEIPGASVAFDRGFVTYSNTAKTQMLGVDPTLIEIHGAVSEAVATAMAEGALIHSDARLSVSVTGIAGPGGTVNKPEGMVCFGVSRMLANKIESRSMTRTFGAIGRRNVRTASVEHALSILQDTLSQSV